MVLSRDLKMTRAHLLSGRPGPLALTEYVDWQALYRLEAEERKEREKMGGRKPGSLGG